MSRAHIRGLLGGGAWRPDTPAVGRGGRGAPTCQAQGYYPWRGTGVHYRGCPGEVVLAGLARPARANLTACRTYAAFTVSVLTIGFYHIFAQAVRWPRLHRPGNVAPSYHLAFKPPGAVEFVH